MTLKSIFVSEISNYDDQLAKSKRIHMENTCSLLHWSTPFRHIGTAPLRNVFVDLYCQTVQRVGHKYSSILRNVAHVKLNTNR
jgi:hypothetical protein